VLITDLLLLPGGSGFGLVRHAKSLRAFRHVVVFSEFVTPAVADRCRKLGADAVFLKSELQQLLDYLRELAS
jgi:DNA-binding NarL/FixJ family response regulator